MNETERIIRQRLKDDFEHYAAKALKIRSKDGSIIPLILNDAQRYVHLKVEEQFKLKGLVRAINLKGRQQGISTYWEARYYHKVTHRKGVRAYILTHEDEATKTIFEMVERFHDKCPRKIRPHAGNASAKELYFDLLDSGYAVGTAGNKATGRSKTTQYFHGSEVAHWPNADAHKAGVIQTVPDAPGTEIALESTAFGVGGMFHDFWKDAEQGKNEYIPIFVPWYWQREYRKPVPPGFKRTQEENDLVRRFKLDDMQLAWRRNKISDLKPSEGGNPEDLFKQEYPCEPEEAFLFSGRAAFSARLLNDADQECFNPIMRAEVNLASGKLDPADQGRLRVWEKPKAGKRYVIGADVAEGLEHGDFSCADILEIPSGKQVAQWHGHIDPDMYGEVLYRMGILYNHALIGVERNNHGLTTLKSLRDRNYSKLYVQVDLEHRVDEKETRKVGWLTTHKSKYKIIDQLAAELRDGNHGIFCKETIQEMRTYIIDEEGRYGAKPGCFDDRVMSRAIAGEIMLNQPTADHPVNKPARPRGDPAVGF